MRDPRELASRLVKPRLTAYRKITRAGNSLYIAPPRPFLHALGLLKGDLVELVLDDYARRFYVKAVKPRRVKREPDPSGQLELKEVR